MPDLTLEQLESLKSIAEQGRQSVPGKWEAELYRYPLGDTGDYDHCAVVKGVFGDQQLARPFASIEDLGHDADAQKNLTTHIASFDPPTCITLIQMALECVRLRRGDFTPEEFQDLCHSTDVQKGFEAFADGCDAYQQKVFGRCRTKGKVL